MTEVANYRLEITNLVNEFSNNVDHLELPFHSLLTSHNNLNNLIISGSFSLENDSEKLSEYLYVPYYFGNLTIKMNGKIVFEDDPMAGLPSLNTYRNALVEIPEFKIVDSHHVILELRTDSRIFSSLSGIYVGSNVDMMRSMKIRSFFSEFLRVAFWGILIFISFSLALLSINRRIGYEGVPLLVICIFMLGISSAEVLSNFTNLGNLSKYTMQLSPILVLAAREFGLVNVEGKRVKAKIYQWHFAIILSVGTIAVELFLPDSRSLLFISLPILFAGFIFVYIDNLRVFWKIGDMKSALWALSISSITLAIFHDLIIRFGAFGGGVYVIGLGNLIFFSSLSLIIVARLLQARDDLVANSLIVKTKLAAREIELEVEHKRYLVIREHAVANEQNLKLTRDLHDGVLTYLSMIYAMTETSVEPRDSTIRTLAQNATQEIRLILDSSDTDRNDVFLVLSLLRSQIVDPLVDMGLSVHWDILALLERKLIHKGGALDLFRILQEAVHNATIRAKCTEIRVEAYVDDSEVVKIILKNLGGCTYDANINVGFGIRNMQRRATSIGAKFELATIPTGAELILTFPTYKESSSV
ncbi:sensor histidine kinase [Marivita sp.]|uniref:sensor histidine kinase n=1 Tax=Marivita sp. TaxID=2003365 RepID=UPI003F4A9DA0